MKLSKNFTLEEFLVSETAARHDIDMTPPEDVLDNLQVLVTTCLQPLRESLDSSIHVTSGYRPPLLNMLIKGSSTSAHMHGRAADLRAAGFTPLEVCQRVIDLALPFDQIIHEFGIWSHLGISEDPRAEALTAYRYRGITNYAWGVVPISTFSEAVA